MFSTYTVSYANELGKKAQAVLNRELTWDPRNLGNPRIRTLVLLKDSTPISLLTIVWMDPKVRLIRYVMSIKEEAREFARRYGRSPAEELLSQAISRTPGLQKFVYAMPHKSFLRLADRLRTKYAIPEKHLHGGAFFFKPYAKKITPMLPVS